MFGWKKTIFIGLLASFGTGAWASEAPKVSAAVTEEFPASLQKILLETKALYNRQERPTVVFDLDGTLFDNRPRIQQILKEYAQSELKKTRPKLAEKIKNIQLNEIKYHVTDTLKSIGIEDQAVITNAVVFWSNRFYSDDYLQYDVPPPGVVEYVRTLYSSGARIVYLSGRDAPRQLIGTITALRTHGFPIGIQSSELILKPSVETSDAIFKQRITAYLRHHGTVVGAFDSESVNINVFRRAFQKATCVRFEANHRPNSPPLLPEVISLASFEKIPVETPEAPAPIVQKVLPRKEIGEVIAPSAEDPASEQKPLATTEPRVIDPSPN